MRDAGVPHTPSWKGASCCLWLAVTTEVQTFGKGVLSWEFWDFLKSKDFRVLPFILGGVRKLKSVKQR